MPVGPRPAPPVGTCRVALSGTVHTDAWVNVLWLNLTLAGSATIDDLKAVIDGMATAWATDMAPELSNVTELTASKGVWLYAAGEQLTYEGSYSHAGGDTGTPLDNAACAVIDWAISDYYRGGHPRSYVPGAETSWLTNGAQLDPTRRSNLATAANNWRNAINALVSGNITGVELGTVRFQSADAWLVPPVFRPYTSASCRGTLGIQRRRLGAS